MPSCDRSLIVFFIHSRCESCFPYSVSNKSDDVIVLNDLVELTFLRQFLSDVINTCCVKQMLKNSVRYFCTLHCITSASGSKPSGDRKLLEKFAHDDYGAKKSVAVKTLVRLLTCLEY